MARTENALRLRVYRGGQVSQKFLLANQQFTVGQSTENDLELLGETYPPKHVLFARNHSKTILRIPKFAEGEIWTNESKLLIRDLRDHGLLPSQNGIFILPLSEGKEGSINLGNNVRVEFSFTQITLNQPQLNIQLQPFSGFNWTRVMIKDFFNDIYFKLIFMFFLLLNSIILYAYKDVKIVRKPEDLQKQTERLMKVSMRIFPKKELDAQIKQLSQPESTTKEESGNKKEEKGSEQKSSRSEQRSSGKKSSGNQNSGGGLLGVIAGSGSSTQGSSVLDFLVDKGLTSELTSAMGSGSNLRVGKGGSASNSEDLLSGIIGTGGDGGLGGIDDLIDEYVEDEVKTNVKLEKKSQIQVEKPTESNISQEAQGYRTEQSVMAIINKIQGRLQYIFEKYLKRDTEFRGKVTIELTIAANGTISSAKIRASSTGNPAFDQEILQTIKRLKFPAIPEGSANFVIPFVFQRMG